MRKFLKSTAISDLNQVLNKLGYRPVFSDGNLSKWRRESFHLIIIVRGDIMLNLHKDVDVPIGFRGHRAVHGGRDIRIELSEIAKNFRKVKEKKQKKANRAVLTRSFYLPSRGLTKIIYLL